MAVLSLVYGPDRTLGMLAKRCIDIVAGRSRRWSILSPLLLRRRRSSIRLRDGAPVFFRQQRVGLHGRPFTVVKFRTMVPDAEEQLAELEDRNEITRPGVQDDRRPARSPGPAAGSAGRASTSCPSSGTSCAAR